MASELVLGVDLGTTYSTAAAVIDGRFQFALDGRGEASIPSVVHFPKSGPPVVGAEAVRLRPTDPQNTIVGIKRVVGRPGDSPAARLLDQTASFRVKRQPKGEVSVVVRSGEYTATEVASLILRYLRERAELRFGRRVSKAVLTVPVMAGAAVREAMLRCGRMAGLEITRIISEPCAGGVARGMGAAGVGSAPVLVYDFGGGTLDATVVQRDGLRLRARSAGGDDCLGGDDFDTAFARWVGNGVYRLHGVDVTRDAVLWDRIQRQCELVKRALSSSSEARFQLRDAFSVGGRVQHLDYAVRREHLSPHWAELVDRSIAAAAQTVDEAGISNIADLGAVLLIGGTTFVPQVRVGVAQAFPRPCVIEDDPQTAVARGAALLASDPSLLVE
ncbi:MAG TPA: Hsp70 family protein [Anaeromyxobacter sp.]|nr:Hsp70 family protein [Anaeromyxobacter sp.]